MGEIKTSEKRSFIPGLLIGLVVVFIAGLAAEVVLKLIYIAGLHPEGRMEDDFVIRQIFKAFGNEAVPLFIVPSMVLNWIEYMPKDLFLYAARWLPYLVLFSLPIICSFLRKRQIPLIICAAFTGLEAVCLMVFILSSQRAIYSVFHVVPFIIEVIVLILMCVALTTRKRGFMIAVGVAAALFAMLSPLASAILSGVDMSTIHAVSKGTIGISSVLIRSLRNFSVFSSPWPIFKTFAFLMYALIMFITQFRYKKSPLNCERICK